VAGPPAQGDAAWFSEYVDTVDFEEEGWRDVRIRDNAIASVEDEGQMGAEGGDDIPDFATA
jgi:hypothetical protein